MRINYVNRVHKMMMHLAAFQFFEDWNNAKNHGSMGLGSTLEDHKFQHADNAFRMLQLQPKTKWRAS
jgi:hypothetical protein